MHNSVLSISQKLKDWDFPLIILDLITFPLKHLQRVIHLVLVTNPRNMINLNFTNLKILDYLTKLNSFKC